MAEVRWGILEGVGDHEYQVLNHGDYIGRVLITQSWQRDTNVILWKAEGEDHYVDHFLNRMRRARARDSRGT